MWTVCYIGTDSSYNPTTLLNWFFRLRASETNNKMRYNNEPRPTNDTTKENDLPITEIGLNKSNFPL
ncbi:hypothetical protein QE152_g24303 [Popillia japonica]|uniref:Uncharacterized protein n=1 Tax=Popillia japonica TaxID=7064 RepID=A0AAW1KH30_POPJA